LGAHAAILSDRPRSLPLIGMTVTFAPPRQPAE
jgi:hypothetical protein